MIMTWLKWTLILAGISELALIAGVFTMRLFGMHLRLPVVVLAGLLLAVGTLMAVPITIALRRQERDS